LLLEEFGCNYKYKEGSQNLVANALSHVPMSRLVREKTAGPREKNLISQPNQPQEPYKDNQACITKENPLLAECLLVYPVFNEHNITRHPFHFATMQHYQQRSDATKQLLINQPEQYALVTLGKTNLICNIANPQQPKIVLTDDMLPRIVRYYHLTAQHAKAMDRLEWSLKRHFYHLRLRDEVRSQVSQCKICQKMKRYSTNFMQFPAREATSVPWEQVHVDLISPLWNIKVKGHKKPVQFIALTCIDPVLNLLEVGTVKDKTSEQVTKTFECLWLSCYP
jgi:Integrase zinc binding domain